MPLSTPFPIFERLQRREILLAPDHLVTTGDMTPDAFCGEVLRAVKLDCHAAFDAYAGHCEVARDESGVEVRHHISMADYPQAIPPWKRTWTEWRSDPLEADDGRSIDEGALVIHFQEGEPGYDEYFRHFDPVEGVGGDPKHILVTRPCFLVEGRAQLVPVTLMSYLDKDGRIVAAGSLSSSAMPGGNPIWTTLVHMPLFSFCLVNCRNISTQPTDGMCRGTRKAGTKRRPKRFFRYYTLKLHGRFSGSSERGEGSQSSSAQHIVRGNFAHYSQEKPLFGKFHGLFWRPMHVRGSVKHGIVSKDYAIGDVGPMEVAV
jgi:hypothetical protein